MYIYIYMYCELIELLSIIEIIKYLYNLHSSRECKPR